MKTPHTATYKHKKVYVKLRNGEEFIDRFMDRNSLYVVFAKKGKIRRGEIRSFSIYKNNTIMNPK